MPHANSCLFNGCSKDTKKKRNVLDALQYTVATLQQVTQQTIENCFRKAGYVQEQSSGDSDVLTNDNDDFRPLRLEKVQWHEQR
jgi:hypothetical protein